MAEFDINSVETNEYTDVVIVHPISKKPTGATIRVGGEYSREYRKALREFRDVKLSDPNVDGEESALDMLVTCTVGWSGFTDNGKPHPFTPENVRALYKKHRWIREQVDSAILDKRLFIRG